MKLQIAVTRPKLWKAVRRSLKVGLWVFGGGAVLGAVFGLSFLAAMRVEMRGSEVRIPELTGLTFEDALEKVAPLELVLQQVEERHDPAVASGLVLQQVPPANASVRRGRKVKLIMSLGGKVLEVPDMIGQASRAVEIELRQAGFIPGDEARVPYRQPPGAGHRAGPARVFAGGPQQSRPSTRLERRAAHDVGHARPHRAQLESRRGVDRARGASPGSGQAG